jgi:hypothetical protein
MFKSTRLICLLGLLFCVANLIVPLQALSFYEADVPYKAFSGKAPQPSAPIVFEAFKEVLLKVSGTETLLTTHEVQQAAKEMDKYVDQFSFPTVPAGAERAVRIHFNEALVNKLLAITKHPVREKKCPLTLVWLVIEREKGPKWVGSGSEFPVQQQVEAIAARYAIPVVFPLLDLVETNAISEKNIWEGVTSPLALSAARYNAGAVLVGKIKGGQGAYRSDWTLYISNQSSNWNVAATELESLFTKMLEQLPKKLNNSGPTQIITVAEERSTALIEEITLGVSGITTMEQYAKIESYLRALPVVKEVEVTQISAEQTLFKIKATVQCSEVASLIANNPVLREEELQQEETGNLFYKMVDTAL